MAIPSLLRRESIIIASIDLIDEVGLQAFSTKEVARRLKIAEGTVFRYFPKKNDLLYAVLEQFSLYDRDIIDTTRIKGMSPLDALLFYISFKTQNYENYPAITVITQSYDVLRRIPDLKVKVETILSDLSVFISQCLEGAKRESVLKADTDSSVLTDIIVSIVSGLCLKWRMSEGGFPLQKSVMQAVILTVKPYYNQE